MQLNGTDHAPAHLISLARRPGWTIGAFGREMVVLAKENGQSFVCAAEDRPRDPKFTETIIYCGGRGVWL